MFGVALLVSLFCSLAAGWLYARFYERRGTGSQVHRAFPLLGISITALFVCIQVSLPLSLGLLGALSIIRFRTPIKEPEEVGFIMLVIASSIICATFNFQFLMFLFATAVLVLILVRNARSAARERGDGFILVTLKDSAAEGGQKAVEECVRSQARRAFLESCVRKEGTVSLHFSFSGFHGEPADLQSRLKAVADPTSVSLFFNRPGGGG
jgi:membrane protein implicated in regulation of membrane protease activity